MKLKVSKESKTGLNTEFVNIESGRKIKLEQAIQQVGKGNPSYQNYVAVKNPNGTTYLRSKPNGSVKDNMSSLGNSIMNQSKGVGFQKWN